jgi:hypothetical protein
MNILSLLYIISVSDESTLAASREKTIQSFEEGYSSML